jgi:uncharacterized protein YfaS (alpha-2-macroglobulin family)
MLFDQKLPLALGLCALSLFACKWLGKNEPPTIIKDKPTTEMPMPTLPPTGDYADDWRIVDSLQNQGLYKTALEKVEAIQTRAARDKNGQQVVKAILFRGKFITMLEEDGLAKAIQTIQKEALAAAQPEKSVLQSLLGELHSTYLSNQGWRIRERTEITPPAGEAGDLLTWSAAQIERHALALYSASVEQQELLRGVPVERFRDVTTPGAHDSVSNIALRPTLFDLLAHRALAHFANERSYLTEPTYAFQLDQPSAFADWDIFQDLKFETQDTTSGKWLAINLFQKLLRAYPILSAGDNTASRARLVDVDLARLQFVWNNSTLENKDELYQKALETLDRQTANHPSQGEVAHQWARFLVGLESDKAAHAKAAVARCEEVLRRQPDTYGARLCAQLLAETRATALNLNVEQVSLPNQPTLFLLECKNLKTAHVKVVRGSFDRQAWESIPWEKQLEYLNGLPVLQARTWAIQDPGDYQTHRTELALEGLPFGKYWVLVSEVPDFQESKGTVAYAKFAVSNLAAMNFDERSKSRFLLADRLEGKPLEGVRMEFFQRDYSTNRDRLMHTATSNRAGLVQPDLPEGSYFSARASLGDDTLWVSNGYNGRYQEDRSEQRQVHFFTDRALYRPGQTVYFKGILFKNAYPNRRRGSSADNDLALPQIIPNQAISVHFYDANGQSKAELKLKSNEFGTFNGAFSAPATGLTGQMSIRAVEGAYGTTFFNVEEYKRPRFEVTMKPVEGAFRLREKITVRGEAKNYAGSAVDGAQVRYRVVRTARFPYFDYWRAVRRPNLYESDAREIANGTTMSGADGAFSIEFEAVPDGTIPKKELPTFDYQIVVDVTDLTGETRSGQTNVSVGYTALQVDLDLGENIALDSLRRVGIRTRNLAGQATPAEGQITLQRLVAPKRFFKARLWQRADLSSIAKGEFERLFPDFAWQDEDNPEKWGREDFTRSVPFNTASDKTLDLHQGRTQPGWYLMTLKTKDAFGESVDIQKFVRVFEGQEYLETPFAQAEKTTLQPGETARIALGSSQADAQSFFFAFERDGLLKPEWHNVRKATTLEIPVTENDRGGMVAHWFAIRDNRVYGNSALYLNVPWSNKDLIISYETFRDKLAPGQQEEWRIKISGPKKEKVAAEMVAAMYDASLDQFRAHDWSPISFPIYSGRVGWGSPMGFELNYAMIRYQAPAVEYLQRSYRAVNWFDFPMWGNRFYMMSRAMDSDAIRAIPAQPMAKIEATVAGAAPEMEEGGDVKIRGSRSEATEYYVDGVRVAGKVPPGGGVEQKPAAPPAPIRSNLNETVFFFPELRTDADGNVVLKFKMNEALTRWKLLTYAHTKDLQQALSVKEVVTQKELMVIPNPPRFLREGDEIEFSAKVSNLSQGALNGSATLNLLDASTLQPIGPAFGLDSRSAQVSNFSVAAGQSTALTWRLRVPAQYAGAVTWQVFAEAGAFRDGEESTVPVVSNRTLVTETLPIALRGNQTKNFVFENLKNGLASGNNSSLITHNYTLEFTSNPVWYAVQSLPYLMEFPHECSEQIFSRFYANTLASNVVEKMPNIKRVYERWKGTDAMKSNLSKNQELKYALLEETPWVLDAQNEAQQKQNIALLFDLNRMADERERALNTLAERQLASGAWPWFAGGPDSWYITQHIAAGFAHLQKLGALDPQKDPRVAQMLDKAIGYCDAQIRKQYADLERLAQAKKTKMDDDHLDGTTIQYLYVKSFAPVDRPSKEVGYYLSQAEKYWLNKGLYQEGMLALALHRHGRQEAAAKIVASLRERAIVSSPDGGAGGGQELGMYWPVNWGFYWYQLPIETQALMVEVFSEVANDAKAVEELRIWLLKNKQTNRWESTKATAEAVYALLLNGSNWLENTRPVQVSIGGKPLKINEYEAGTGYFKQTWSGAEVKKTWADLKVENPNSNIVWGAAYWQYFEDLDKIKDFQKTPLTIVKQLFLEENTPSGPVLKPIAEGQTLRRGDKIKVRIEIRVDRAMEFVHLKDMRAAGLEPTNVLSGYRWKDGLGYYESTKDLATHFFMDYLPRGTFVFEYPLVVSLRGDMSNGITTMQCMYAPEFTSHSKGVRVWVE